MNHFYSTIRTFTGIFFVIIAGSKFGILPSAVNRPEAFTPEGFAFISAINANGYIFPTIGIFSLVCGLAFIFNRYTALATVIMVPITLNFALFHIFLGLEVDSFSSFIFLREAISYIPLALILYILYNERSKYATLLRP